MLIVAVVVMGAAIIIVKTLNAATWKADRLRITTEAFAKAKEALIARAVTDDNRPGSLPCPDTDGDGAAELFAGNQCPSYIGRLPWRTLQLPDIRDAEGERLWYVLSRTHRDHGAAEPINSDTIGEITVNGTLPTTQALAVLISPGRPLIRSGAANMQARDCPANCYVAANYLDVAGGVDNAAWNVVGGVVNLTYVPESDSFNDRLLAIRADDVMPLVEKRAGREISLALRARYEAWQAATGRGFYPWPAPFNDPANPGAGISGTMHGHLPSNPPSLVWTSGSANLGSCSGVGTPTLTCTATVGLFLLTISGTVNGIATGFADAPAPPVVSGLPLVDWHTWTVNSAAQRLEFQYNALLGIVTVTVQAPQFVPWAPVTSPWLVNNQWNRVASYAISHGHKITGPGACNAMNPCISLGGGPGDKEAVVVMTGRRINGQASRPPTPLPMVVTNYLEGANATFTSANLTLERNLRSATFNDQPAVVHP